MIMTENRSKTGLRILAIHRYYWPDTPPYASLLRSIVERWAADGHSVDVLSTQPSYKQRVNNAPAPEIEVIGNVTVRRVSLPQEAGRGRAVRILNMLRFFFSILYHAGLRRRYDIIMVSTAPPVLPGAAVRIVSVLTGARFIYHCMDIHPEIGRISGEFRKKWLYKLLLRIDSTTCARAWKVVVLSEDMKKSVCSRPGLAQTDVSVINNFTMPDHNHAGRTEIPVRYEKRAGIFRVLFAGNLGRFQGLENIIEAFHILERNDADIELILMGDGKAHDKLKMLAGTSEGRSIRFIPHQPVAVAARIIRDADIGVVSLVPGIYRYAYPSKTMVYLSEACPLLAIVEDESSLAKFIRAKGVGVSVSQKKGAEGIADVIRSIRNEPELLAEMSARAREVGKLMFGCNEVLDRWSGLLSDFPG